jgi:hypothetical protein
MVMMLSTLWKMLSRHKILLPSSGIEKDDDKYKDQVQSLSSGEGVSHQEAMGCEEESPSSKGIDVGCKVQECGKHSLHGRLALCSLMIAGRVAASPSVKSVLFDGKTDPVGGIPSTKLQLVKDKREILNGRQSRIGLPSDHE